VNTQLRVVWEGEAPGLQEGRLSLALFGSALQALLKAVRNIAAAQVAMAVGEPVDFSRATKRTYVDLHLSAFRSGSSDLTFEAVALPMRTGAPLVDALPERVISELLESIRDESRGLRRNRWVNDYLRALPEGVSRQRYVALRDGQEARHIDVEQMVLAELPAVAEMPAVADSSSPLPYLRRMVGHVVGVNFEPLHEIRIAPESGQPELAIPATKEQVAQAVDLSLRRSAVQVMIAADDKQTRLLWIREAQAPVHRLTEEEREEHIFRKWEELLRRLSR
jgi:hypothetical protein